MNVDDGTVVDEVAALVVSKLNAGVAATLPPPPLRPNVIDDAAVEAAVTTDELVITGVSVAKTGL